MNKARNFQNPDIPVSSRQSLTYLALGDSYTIGEGVGENERFPNQLSEMLSRVSFRFKEVKIVARSGWTTAELETGIEQAKIGEKKYDLVTLLIGVNNQYRGQNVAQYEMGFGKLLEQAVRFANGHASRVIVLSIPDWGITPFADSGSRNPFTIAEEIDVYNAANQKITKIKGAHYIDITEEYRKIGRLPENLAGDGLHPGGKVYKKWAETLQRYIEKNICF